MAHTKPPATSVFKATNYSPCELWLSLAEERVTRAERREVPSLSELSVCSGSVEKSESSVPSELLPAFLYNTTEPAVSTKALNLLHCVYATRTHRNKTPLDAKLVKSPTPGVFKVGCGA